MNQYRKNQLVYLIRKNYVLDGGIEKFNSNPTQVVPFSRMRIKYADNLDPNGDIIIDTTAQGVDMALRTKPVQNAAGITNLFQNTIPLLATDKADQDYLKISSLEEAQFENNKLQLLAGTNVTRTVDDNNLTLTFSATGGSGGSSDTIVIPSTALTQEAAISYVKSIITDPQSNIGRHVRISNNAQLISYFGAENFVGTITFLDDHSLGLIGNIANPSGFDTLLFSWKDDNTGAGASLTSFKQADARDNGDDYSASVNDVKQLLLNNNGVGIKFTGAQYISDAPTGQEFIQRICHIPVPVPAGDAPISYLSFGYKVQAQLNNSIVQTPPQPDDNKYTSSSWSVSCNVQFDFKNPNTDLQVRPKVVYSGIGGLNVRTWYGVDKTDGNTWYFEIYQAVSPSTNDHYDWYEFVACYPGPSTITVDRNHIDIEPTPTNNQPPTWTPARISVLPNWVSLVTEIYNIADNKQAIQSLGAVKWISNTTQGQLNQIDPTTQNDNIALKSYVDTRLIPTSANDIQWSTFQLGEFYKLASVDIANFFSGGTQFDVEVSTPSFFYSGKIVIHSFPSSVTFVCDILGFSNVDDNTNTIISLPKELGTFYLNRLDATHFDLYFEPQSVTLTGGTTEITSAVKFSNVSKTSIGDFLPNYIVETLPVSAQEMTFGENQNITSTDNSLLIVNASGKQDISTTKDGWFGHGVAAIAGGDEITVLPDITTKTLTFQLNNQKGLQVSDTNNLAYKRVFVEAQPTDGTLYSFIAVVDFLAGPDGGSLVITKDIPTIIPNDGTIVNNNNIKTFVAWTSVGELFTTNKAEFYGRNNQGNVAAAVLNIYYLNYT